MKCRLPRLFVLLGVAPIAASRYGEQFLRDHKQWIADIGTHIASGSRVLVLDVGANNGWWGKHYTSLLQKTSNASQVSLCMFEPQPRFHKQLAQIARDTGGRLMAVAAWTEDTTITIHLLQSDKSGVAASMSASHADPNRSHRNLTLPAIDFGRFLREEAPKYRTVVLKLDVEGAEYQLLPRLLMTGSLCRVHFLQLEWHLKYEPEQGKHRLAALAMRHSIDELLRRGCANDALMSGGEGPRSILHDEAYNNGIKGGFVHVPGLEILAKRHAP